MGKATPVGAISRALTGPARSKTPDMHGTSTRENREALPRPDTKLWAGRSRKVMSHNLDMNVGRESDGRVVPAKCPNKGGSLSPAEGMERRRPTQENTEQLAATQTQSWVLLQGRLTAGVPTLSSVGHGGSSSPRLLLKEDAHFSKWGNSR